MGPASSTCTAGEIAVGTPSSNPRACRTPLSRPHGQGYALAGGQHGMEITVKSQAGEPELIQDVARLERGTL